MTQRVVVVGAGFGGLSAAALLAQQGHSVTVVEKNSQPGGRAGWLKQDGFSFDMGPSWYLMPEVFERFFAMFDKKVSDYYTLSRLETSYRLFFGDDDYVDIVADLEKNKQLFDRLEDGGGAQLQKYLDAAEYKYDVAINHFLYKEYRHLFDFFSWRMLTEGRKLHVFESYDKYVRRFFSSERAKKILQYSNVFLGGSPKNTPALYSLMSHVDFNLGVWYPQGGMHSVALGMEKLCKQLGVRFTYDCEVTKILVDNGRTFGVATKKGDVQADVVLVNADYAFAEMHLLDEENRTYKKKYWESRVMAPSGFVIFLGLDKKVPQLQHHNLFLDNDWVRHFDAIFKNPSWPTSPSYYVCCPSKTDATVAPKKGENLFFLVPVASGLNDTPKVREQFKKMILKHFSGLVGWDVTKHMRVCEVFAHKEFKERYHAYKGTALGMSHTLMQTALFRPSHVSKKVRGLYYSGHYTHPGIGVPMTLISSQVVSERIKKDLQ